MSITTIKSKIGIDRPDIKMSELITEILYYYDPVGSADLYVPEDEYEPEARMIINHLKDVTDMRSLRWIVYDVFERFFSKDMILPSSDKCYRFIAEEIWEVWQEAIRL